MVMVKWERDRKIQGGGTGTEGLRWQEVSGRRGMTAVPVSTKKKKECKQEMTEKRHGTSRSVAYI